MTSRKNNTHDSDFGVPQFRSTWFRDGNYDVSVSEDFDIRFSEVEKEQQNTPGMLHEFDRTASTSSLFAITCGLITLTVLFVMATVLVLAVRRRRRLLHPLIESSVVKFENPRYCLQHAGDGGDDGDIRHTSLCRHSKGSILYAGPTVNFYASSEVSRTLPMLRGEEWIANGQQNSSASYAIYRPRPGSDGCPSGSAPSQQLQCQSWRCASSDEELETIYPMSSDVHDTNERRPDTEMNLIASITMTTNCDSPGMIAAACDQSCSQLLQPLNSRVSGSPETIIVSANCKKLKSEDHVSLRAAVPTTKD